MSSGINVINVKIFNENHYGGKGRDVKVKGNLNTPVRATPLRAFPGRAELQKMHARGYSRSGVLTLSGVSTGALSARTGVSASLNTPLGAV